MDASAFFEPSLKGYVSYCLGFCLRYFGLAGGIYLVSHVAFKRQWLVYRIQSTFPARADIAYEIRWSLLNTLCTGVSTLFIYQLVRDGRTSMYFTIADYGWLYFGISILLCIAGYDTWIYWQHRLLHTRWLFRHVHSVHHRLANPTPFAAFAQHPVETFMGNVYFILFVVFVPLHPLAIAAAGLYMFVIGIIAHSGYELYPQGFTRHRVFGWHNTSTHHNMHHQHVGCNYGNWFNYWDRLMRTNHVAYHDTFDAVTGRRRAASNVEGSVRRAA
jgi:lathosterol oxidase